MSAKHIRWSYVSWGSFSLRGLADCDQLGSLRFLLPSIFRISLNFSRGLGGNNVGWRWHGHCCLFYPEIAVLLCQCEALAELLSSIFWRTAAVLKSEIRILRARKIFSDAPKEHQESSEGLLTATLPTPSSALIESSCESVTATSQ